MTIQSDEIQSVRRDNFFKILDLVYNGVQQKMAESTGIHPSDIVRLKKSKPMSTTITRKIEQALNKPGGWMDKERSDREIVDTRELQFLNRNELKSIMAKVDAACDELALPLDSYTRLLAAHVILHHIKK